METLHGFQIVAAISACLPDEQFGDECALWLQVTGDTASVAPAVQCLVPAIYLQGKPL